MPYSTGGGHRSTYKDFPWHVMPQKHTCYTQTLVMVATGESSKNSSSHFFVHRRRYNNFEEIVREPGSLASVAYKFLKIIYSAMACSGSEPICDVR